SYTRHVSYALSSRPGPSTEWTFMAAPIIACPTTSSVILASFAFLCVLCADFLLPLPYGALLDALLVGRVVHDALHEDAGGVNVVRVDLAGLDQVLDLGDRNLAGSRHDRVEVARGLPVDEVALSVALPGVHDRKVG